MRFSIATIAAFAVSAGLVVAAPIQSDSLQNLQNIRLPTFNDTLPHKNGNGNGTLHHFKNGTHIHIPHTNHTLPGTSILFNDHDNLKVNATHSPHNHTHSNGSEPDHFRPGGNLTHPTFHHKLGGGSGNDTAAHGEWNGTHSHSVHPHPHGGNGNGTTTFIHSGTFTGSHTHTRGTHSASATVTSSVA